MPRLRRFLKPRAIRFLPQLSGTSQLTRCRAVFRLRCLSGAVPGTGHPAGDTRPFRASVLIQFARQGGVVTIGLSGSCRQSHAAIISASSLRRRINSPCSDSRLVIGPVVVMLTPQTGLDFRSDWPDGCQNRGIAMNLLIQIAQFALAHVQIHS